MPQSRPVVPTQAEVDAKPHVAGSNPEQLCANWRKGCNGVTDGQVDGKLTFCDDCFIDIADGKLEYLP